VIHPVVARALAGAACCAVTCAVAGCASQASSTSSLTASGGTLSIYLSQPPGASDPIAQEVIEAEQLAFSSEEAAVSKAIGFGLSDYVLHDKTISDNARGAIQDESTIAYLGEVVPGDSEQSVGITNALDILQLSPTDTALELNTKTSAVSGAPNSYYESLTSYGRTFARMVPDSQVEATDLVAAMKAKKITSLALGSDGSDYGLAIVQAVRQAASAAGLSIAASVASADGYFYGGTAPAAAVKAFTAAQSAHSGIALFGPSGLDTTAFLSQAGSLTNLSLSLPVPAASAAVKSFEQAFAAKYGSQPVPQAVFGYAAMQALLQTLKQAGHDANDRATVVKDFVDTTDGSSVIGSYSMDKAGNITSATTFRLFSASALAKG
jgi:hypothetical protein